jgi:hypothetical protein
MEILAGVVIALAAIMAVVVVATGLTQRARLRTEMLRQRFGPEYERTVEQLGARAGERVLAERVRRVDRITFRELTEAERAHFKSMWSVAQAEFVDDPTAAVRRANELIKEAMRACGYSALDGFEQRLADLSVDHPEVVQHYRAARALAQGPGQQGTNTEELRQAMVHYRMLFVDLVDPAREAPRTHQALAVATD